MRRISRKTAMRDPLADVSAESAIDDGTCNRVLRDADAVLYDRGAYAHFLSPILRKASGDTYNYTIGLNDGSRIQFGYLEVVGNGEWLILTGIGSLEGPIKSADDTYGDDSCMRGINVRTGDIVWVREATS